MDVLVFSLSLGVLVAVWILLNKRMKPQHWIIRHCVGASTGVVSMFVVVAMALEVGLIEETTSSSGERDGSDKEEPESHAVMVFDQQAAKPQEERVEAIPINEIYQITKDRANTSVSRSVEVLLDRRVNQTELQGIAEKIKSDGPSGNEYTHIGFRLVSQSPDFIYFAYAIFPGGQVAPEITFNRLSLDQYRYFETLDVKASHSNLVGSWIVERGFNYLANLYVEDGSLYFEEIYPDKSSGRTLYAYDFENDGSVTLFEPDYIENEKNYYRTVDTNGALHFWSEDGRNDYSALPLNRPVDLSQIQNVDDIADWQSSGD